MSQKILLFVASLLVTPALVSAHSPMEMLEFAITNPFKTLSSALGVLIIVLCIKLIDKKINHV